MRAELHDTPFYESRTLSEYYNVKVTFGELRGCLGHGDKHTINDESDTLFVCNLILSNLDISH